VKEKNVSKNLEMLFAAFKVKFLDISFSKKYSFIIHVIITADDMVR